METVNKAHGFNENSNGESLMSPTKFDDVLPFLPADQPYVRLVPSYRLLVAMLGMSSLMASQASQGSMSSALICMIDTAPDWDPVHPNRTSMPSDWKFSWNSDDIKWTLSLHFMAYSILQLPSGFIYRWLGIKTTLVSCLFLLGVFQCLAVPAACMGLHWLYADRFLAGLVLAPIYTTVFSMAANWTPQLETSVMFGMCGIGVEFGVTFTFVVSSIACNIDFQGGWPIVFYAVGSLSFVSAVASLVCLTDWPAENRLIGAKEKIYIRRNTQHDQSSLHKLPIPIKKILLSGPVWGIISCQLGTEWLTYVMTTQFPVFHGDVLKLSPTEIGLISGLPNITVVVTVYAVSVLSDRLMSRAICSKTIVRRLNEGLGKLTSAILIVSLGFLPTGNTPATFVVITLMNWSVSFSYAGYISNVADLSPTHTGFVTSLAQTSSIWVSFAIPIVFEAMTPSKSRREWQIMFYLTAGLQVVAFIIYAIVGSGELQPWARHETTDDGILPCQQEGQGQESEPEDNQGKLSLVDEFDEIIPLLVDRR